MVEEPPAKRTAPEESGSSQPKYVSTFRPPRQSGLRYDVFRFRKTTGLASTDGTVGMVEDSIVDTIFVAKDWLLHKGSSRLGEAYLGSGFSKHCFKVCFSFPF